MEVQGLLFRELNSQIKWIYRYCAEPQVASLFFFFFRIIVFRVAQIKPQLRFLLFGLGHDFPGQIHARLT